jgi:hypothetical protein
MEEWNDGRMEWWKKMLQVAGCELPYQIPAKSIAQSVELFVSLTAHD